MRYPHDPASGCLTAHLLSGSTWALVMMVLDGRNLDRFQMIPIKHLQLPVIMQVLRASRDRELYDIDHRVYFPHHDPAAILTARRQGQAKQSADKQIQASSLHLALISLKPRPFGLPSAVARPCALRESKQKQVITLDDPAPPRRHAWTPANRQRLPEHGQTVNCAT